MSNKTVTQLQYDSGIERLDADQDEIFRFDGSATWKPMTIMARRVVSIAAGAITGTGTREATMTSRAGKTAQVGTYNLVAGTLSSGAGEWTLTAPDGRTETYTTSTAGEDMTFEDLGVDVEIADTGTDFVTADEIDFVVSENSNVVPFVDGGVDGAQDPIGVLTHEMARTTAGTESGKLMTRGIVRKHRTVIHADGDDSNLDKTIRDKLHAAGVHVRDTQVLSQQES